MTLVNNKKTHRQIYTVVMYAEKVLDSLVCGTTKIVTMDGFVKQQQGLKWSWQGLDEASVSLGFLLMTCTSVQHSSRPLDLFAD